MGKSWRERIQEARERGRFTRQDREDATHIYTCAVGEQIEKIPGLLVQWAADGLGLNPWSDDPTRCGLWRHAGMFPGAIRMNNFARAESILDAAEDRALQLKREYRGDV